MRILVIRGNPRKKGHTQYITDLVTRGASEAGASVEDISLSSKTISTCLGCYNCWSTTPGICVHKDDMIGLLEQVKSADVLLCATPFYNYSMSTAMKQFAERLLPLTKPHIVDGPGGYCQNELRYPDTWGKKSLVYITAAAFKNCDIFDGLTKTFSFLAHGLNMDFGGAICRPESFLLQFHLSRPKTVKIIETALMQSGRELAANGSVSPETLQKIAIPLTIDRAHFQKYSNIYWEYVTAMHTGDRDMEKVKDLVLHDARILMHEMARCIDPLTTAKLKAVLQFNFPDREWYYCITVNRGSCTLEEKKSDTFDLCVTADAETWGKAFSKQISFKDALMKRQIILEGDKSLFMRLDRFFPPPGN